MRKKHLGDKSAAEKWPQLNALLVRVYFYKSSQIVYKYHGAKCTSMNMFSMSKNQNPKQKLRDHYNLPLEKETKILQCFMMFLLHGDCSF